MSIGNWKILGIRFANNFDYRGEKGMKKLNLLDYPGIYSFLIEHGVTDDVADKAQEIVENWYYEKTDDWDIANRYRKHGPKIIKKLEQKIEFLHKKLTEIRNTLDELMNVEDMF